MNTATITAKSRNLAFAFSTQPTGRGTEIALPAAPAPAAWGGPSAVARAMDESRKYLSGGEYYSTACFVGGRRILSYRVITSGEKSESIFDQSSRSNEIAMMMARGLRGGTVVEVTLEDAE
ncbi:MAG: hypothetical protein JWO59_682 [Chloroflexi bacterium]|nr:hypothetical protein [Chloroflexota bacterium]